MLGTIFNTIRNYLALIEVTDVFDVLIVAYIIYKVLKFIRDTRALQLLKGLGILLVVFQVSIWANLNAVNFILRNAMQVGIIAIFIVFAPEFRRALEQVGRSSISKWFGNDEQDDKSINRHTINEIIRSVEHMQKSKIGALIVIEKNTKIGDIISTGVNLGADITAELLVNIFIPRTPLHDGAVVIRGNKVEAAGCFLPLSQNPDISKELGTRHRAGLGISEESDAVVVIVSEETGRISIAEGGELKRGLAAEHLSQFLILTFETRKDKKTARDFIPWRDRNGNSRQKGEGGDDE